MKTKLLILMALGAVAGQGADYGSEFAAGRAYYARAEFKKAVVHFEQALHNDPSDAASNYWIGMSYQALADIAIPFGGKYRSKARAHLTKAAELAPDRPEYRRELFDLLTDSVSSSRSGVRQARDILKTTPEGDPEYSYMTGRIDAARGAGASADARLGQLFLGVPRAADFIVGLRFIEWLRNCFIETPF
jgi:tetratricopeptide (TPR) repeat protein